MERHYPAPRNRFLRWIGEIGDQLPDEIQSRLRSNFVSSRVPLVVGALNTAFVTGVIYVMTLRPVFLLLAVADFLLLGVRIRLLNRAEGSIGPLFATGLLWSCIQATTTALVVLSGDPVLSLIAMASAYGAVGGIAGRNFAARRYALTQTLLIDASFKIPFAFMYPQFLPLVLLQSVAFTLMTVGIVRQHRERAIAAIQGELASRELAFVDPLTGLGNRRWLQERFHEPRQGAANRALLYMDLDGFKGVNDRLGHAAGDKLLQIVGERLSERRGCASEACRLGGDEFLMLIHGATTAEVRAEAASIIASVATPYEIEPGILARVGATIGIAVDEAGDVPLHDLMARADRALYAAKSSSKGTVLLDTDMEEPRFRLRSEASMRAG